jgi:hypothetical protein
VTQYNRIALGATVVLAVFGVVGACATNEDTDSRRRTAVPGTSGGNGGEGPGFVDPDSGGPILGFSGNDNAGGASGNAGGSAGSAGEGPSPLDASVEAFCAGHGSVVKIPTAKGDECSGDIATKAFRFALCSCTDLSWSSILSTDSFNSTTGTSGENASIGLNLGAYGTGKHTVGGSFWIGANSLKLNGSGRIAKDLHVGGGINSTAPHSIDGDVYSDAAIGSYVTVGGKVHVPAGTTLKSVTAKLGVVNEAVAIAEPCDCKTPALDSAGVVSFLEKTNDNALSSISATELTEFHNPKTLELPCGRYYFDKVSGSATLTFKLKGRTVIAIGRELAMSGAFNFEFEPGAELDLFVGGDVKFSGSAAFGDLKKPARIRMYVAGKQVGFTGGMRLGGNIYAPHATMTASGNIEISGALFANDFGFTGETRIHYDEAILEVPGCGVPTDTTTTCGDCNDCGGALPSCKKGVCSACESDGDCCPPLVCNQGACGVPQVIK